jgi:hypothetical protein
MKKRNARKSRPPILTRKISWKEWEKGRTYRRAIALEAAGGVELRRKKGDPRKDAILRRLNNGKRGMPFRKLEA